MHGLTLSVSGRMHDGSVRVVLAENGYVLMEDALRIPQSPTASDYADALRFFADRVQEFGAKSDQK